MPLLIFALVLLGLFTVELMGSRAHHGNATALGTGLFRAGRALADRRLTAAAVENHQPTTTFVRNFLTGIS
jgi:hypothetical protein